MKLVYKSVMVAVLSGVVAFANGWTVRAAEAPTSMILKPMTGVGVSGQQFLLNLKVGTKQAISYFQNADGHCKLTVMVADAFNGVDVPNSSTVRFEVAIHAGGTAHMDTAEGKSLEFTCQLRAQEMRVRPGSQVSVYPPGT